MSIRVAGGTVTLFEGKDVSGYQLAELCGAVRLTNGQWESDSCRDTWKLACTGQVIVVCLGSSQCEQVLVCDVLSWGC